MTDDGDPPTDPPTPPASDGDGPDQAAGDPAPPAEEPAAAAGRPAQAAPAVAREPLPAAVAHDPHAPPADEPPLAGAVRRVDETVGRAERILLFGAFTVLVLAGVYRTLLLVESKLGAAGKYLPMTSLTAIELTRISAFAIGMFGAAYAAQNRHNFGLDLVSALMSTKVKAVTRVFTNLAALFAAGLLFYGGRLIQAALEKEKQHYELIPLDVVGWFIPVCAALIMFHVTCHLIIEIDYLRRGRTAPEPEIVG